jgi:hypothetical protein
MILGVIILVLVAVIAYFHYVQGLFSATISAICAVIAAVVAVSFHENVINALLKGAMANYAEGMMLVALFALTYVILRVIFDKSIPGNVRYPLMVDKVGAAAMGVVAGLFATGVLVLAAESLPFGPSIAGYARYPVQDRPVVIPGNRGQTDSSTFDEVKDSVLNESRTALDPNKKNTLLIPVNDMLVGVVSTLSSGALSNDHPLAAVHPDWPTELFGQRAGVQVGTKRVLLNLPSLEMVHLVDLFKLDSVPEMDSDFPDMRENKAPLAPAKGDTLKTAPDEMLLITRITFDNNGSDEDSKVRVSPLAVRLVGWQQKGDTKVYVNYNPIGTLEGASVLLRNKPDDPLILSGGKSADFVFKVARADVLKDEDPKAKDLDIKDGVFVEVKRMARIDLGGKSIKGAPTFNKDVEVKRKDVEAFKNLPKRTETGESRAAVQTSAGPLDVTSIKVSDKLFAPVNPGPYQGDTNVSFRSGNATMKDKKFQKLVVNPTDALKMLGQGDNPLTDLYVPDGRKMVQVVAKAPAKGDSFGWTDLSSFDLVDSSGVKYKPNGAAARVKVTGADRMIANYDSDNPVGSIEKSEGRAYDVYLFFNVPTGTQITQLNFQDKPISDKDVKAQ